jgi:hypothetical protein
MPVAQEYREARVARSQLHRFDYVVPAAEVVAALGINTAIGATVAMWVANENELHITVTEEIRVGN